MFSVCNYSFEYEAGGDGMNEIRTWSKKAGSLLRLDDFLILTSIIRRQANQGPNLHVKPLRFVDGVDLQPTQSTVTHNP